MTIQIMKATEQHFPVEQMSIKQGSTVSFSLSCHNNGHLSSSLLFQVVTVPPESLMGF